MVQSFGISDLFRIVLCECKKLKAIVMVMVMVLRNGVSNDLTVSVFDAFPMAFTTRL
jgi:hypothetical protein